MKLVGTSHLIRHAFRLDSNVTQSHGVAATPERLSVVGPALTRRTACSSFSTIPDVIPLDADGEGQYATTLGLDANWSRRASESVSVCLRDSRRQNAHSQLPSVWRLLRFAVRL